MVQNKQPVFLPFERFVLSRYDIILGIFDEKGLFH